MKNITFKATRFLAVTPLLLILAVVTLLFSCDNFELPEEGSIADETPPAAAFNAIPNPANFLEYNFTNLSVSATDYVWNFGDGNTSTAVDPTNAYAEIGTYTVSLTATDKLNATSTTNQEIVIEEPIIIEPPTPTDGPEILNPGFDEEGEDEYRDGWRNSGLGGTIQITSSPIHEGVKAAKLPPEADRIGYQAITVTPNTDYVLSFYYTMKTEPVGSLNVSILGGEVTDPGAIAGATIASFTGTDQSSASDYTFATLEFNSGSNGTVAIYFANIAAESRIDSFTIQEL